MVGPDTPFLPQVRHFESQLEAGPCHDPPSARITTSEQVSTPPGAVPYFEAREERGKGDASWAADPGENVPATYRVKEGVNVWNDHGQLKPDKTKNALTAVIYPPLVRLLR